MQTDVLVIGGGPAGSTAAALLAQSGLGVVLLEKEVFPRYHIGESLIVSVNEFIDLLGVREQMNAYGFQKKTGAFFEWGEDRWKFDWANLTTKHRSSFQVKREEFDHILLKNARARGADVREDVTVRSLAFDGDRPVSAEWVKGGDGKESGTINFRYLVDASGRAGVMSGRYLRSRNYNEAFKNVAVWGYWKGWKLVDTGLTGPITVASVPYGWVWAIPLSDGTLSVGLVVHQTHLQREKATRSIEDIYATALRDSPVITEILASAERTTEVRVESDYSYTSGVLAGPGFFLSGDSACFIDPLLSSGVHLAMYSAMLASACIASIERKEIEQEDAIKFYSGSYGRHYLRWMLIVAAFYDQYRGKDSYFWQAQRLTHHDMNDQNARLAFTKMVSGTEDILDVASADVLSDVTHRLRGAMDSSAAKISNDGAPAGQGQVMNFFPEEDRFGHIEAGGFQLVTSPRLGIGRGKAKAA